jgi:hypothetical protein
MKKLIACLFVFVLSGCAHQLELYSRDGGVNGTGTAQEAGKQITINLDGRVYKGTYTYDGGKTIITNGYGSATAYSGNRSATAYSRATSTSYVPGSGLGRLYAHSQDGKSIRCEFSYSAGSGIGICEDNDNKPYDLVAH